jgi:hypothetical protein
LVLPFTTAVAGASLITGRLPPPLEWFGVCTAALVVVAFLCPFLALAIALPASRLLTAAQPSADRIGAGVYRRRRIAWTPAPRA